MRVFCSCRKGNNLVSTDLLYFLRNCRSIKMPSNTTDYYDYDSQDEVTYLNNLRMLYMVGYLIICILGLPLNFLVIAAGCYSYHNLKKTINGMWVLALAMTHLLCSAFLPLQLVYAWHQFNWHYGPALCKVSSYVIYVSMFTTAAALSLWSVNSSVTSSKCCEGLRTRCVSHRMSMLLIMSSWTLGVVLSSPSLLSRELRYTTLGLQCIDDYDTEKEQTTDEGQRWLIVVVLFRFMLGILFPAFVMFINCCLARRQHRDMDGTSKRVICLIKVAYFVCWTPLLFLGLLQITMTTPNLFKYMLPAATVLAVAHCCANPVIYLLVGCSIKLQWLSQVSSNTA
ncbi:chemokine-like receptor 1 [Electrophorus electricus]|uniref:chemokine-like receptor 1 n=1 Tax=Electrophorus electricus TaxID=8005 RepID=UPI0015D0C1AB|nr:chemokine-like receptor 1 [Electrophorus electricus]